MVLWKTIFSHKELRFAISLPFSAADDAGNGRLSATSICHAPAPFDHAPADPPLLPQATNTGANILCFLRAHPTLHRRSLHPHGAPKMASFSTPAAGVWLVPSRLGYKCTFPNYRSSNFLSPFRLQPPLQTSISLTFLPCYLLFSRSLIHLKFTGSPLTRSAQISDHASTETIQCQQPQDHKRIFLYLFHRYRR